MIGLMRAPSGQVESANLGVLGVDLGRQGGQPVDRKVDPITLELG